MDINVLIKAEINRRTLEAIKAYIDVEETTYIKSSVIYALLGEKKEPQSSGNEDQGSLNGADTI